MPNKTTNRRKITMWQKNLNKKLKVVLQFWKSAVFSNTLYRVCLDIVILKWWQIKMFNDNLWWTNNIWTWSRISEIKQARNHRARSLAYQVASEIVQCRSDPVVVVGDRWWRQVLGVVADAYLPRVHPTPAASCWSRGGAALVQVQMPAWKVRQRRDPVQLTILKNQASCF